MKTVEEAGLEFQQDPTDVLSSNPANFLESTRYDTYFDSAATSSVAPLMCLSDLKPVAVVKAGPSRLLVQ